MKSKTIKLLSIAGAIVLLDQFTKALVLRYLPLYRSVTVIPGFFDLTHVQNPGGAFGFLSGSDPRLRTLVFLFFSLLAVGLILWFYYKTPATHPHLASAFAMICGGAVGNLIDRVRFGKVTDFLDFYVANLHWPAFNVADSAITIGIGVFLLHLLLKKMPE